MRDQLVQSQAKQGHERAVGTSPAATTAPRAAAGSTAPRWPRMMLEVYYRHLPIFQSQSTEADFPLD